MELIVTEQLQCPSKSGISLELRLRRPKVEISVKISWIDTDMPVKCMNWVSSDAVMPRVVSIMSEIKLRTCSLLTTMLLKMRSTCFKTL